MIGAVSTGSTTVAILFKRFRPYWQPPDDPFHHDLPERFVAYRGGAQIELTKPGLSWTLDRAVAAGFAIGHRKIHNRPAVVVTASLSRSDVALVSTERKESELVLFERPVLDEV
jgi:hypothetical protein